MRSGDCGSELMNHHVIRMQAQQHVWKNRVVKNEAEIFVTEIADRQRAGIAAHRQAFVARDPHEPTQERSFGQIILCGIVR